MYSVTNLFEGCELLEFEKGIKYRTEYKIQHTKAMAKDNLNNSILICFLLGL